MADRLKTVGIIGGSGMLGHAISMSLLANGAVTASDFWTSNRSGSSAGFEAFPGINVTADNQILADACDVVILSVPPAMAPNVRISAADRLVISVMAGVPLKKLEGLTGSRRVVRAMSSPAAELGLAYSPWIASPAVDGADRERVRALFEACGMTDEVEEEGLIDTFTAITGPVPGFVAYFADCMARYATDRGVPPAIADRAVRQLFLSSGRMLAEGEMSAGDHVRQMVDYAGTTAAGLVEMQNSSIADGVTSGLDAATVKARQLG